MNNSNTWSHVDTNTNHACNVMQMALSESLGAIQWVNPNDHFILVKFIWKFEEIPVRLRGCLSVDLLQLLQIIPVWSLVKLVILQQHLLGDMRFVNLVWLNIRFFQWIASIIFVFLAYYGLV